MANFCRNCGNRLTPEAKFCTQCGSQVINSGESNQATGNPAVSLASTVVPGQTPDGYRRSFKALGCKEWTITNNAIYINNEVINFRDIVSVHFQNTADAKLINGVITVTAYGKNYVLGFPYSQRAEGEYAFKVIEANYGSEERKASFKEAVIKEESEVVYSIRGVRGRSLKVFPDRVVITVVAGVGSFLTNNASDGEKTIFYADCNGVQFKESGVQIGYLQLETGAKIMNNGNNNFFNENSFTFDQSTTTNEKMKEVRDYIQNQIRAYKSNVQPASAPAISVPEEIMKYKDLADKGIITQEEFEAKKKQLLGL